MDDTEPPEAVRNYGRRLRRATGIEPVMTRETSRRWRVSVANDRVESVAVFRRSPAGKWNQQKGETNNYIDSHPIGTVPNSKALRKLFGDPDNTGIAQPTPMPADADPDHAPAEVRAGYRMFADKFGDNVRLGRRGNVWVIGVDLHSDEHSMSMRANLSPSGDIKVEVILDGKDRTEEVDNDMSKAMALMTGNGPGNSTGPPVPNKGGPSGPARSNAVETRRHSVMRV